MESDSRVVGIRVAACMQQLAGRAVAVLAVLVATVCPSFAQTSPDAPVKFDYQERAGFPLAFEERVISLAAADALMRPALGSGTPTHGDWDIIRAKLQGQAPEGRENVRVVRVFSDQPVFMKQGFALVPDPSRPEAAVSPDDFDVATHCDPTPGNLSAQRCIALHRDHPHNRGAIAVLIAARTIIIKGENATGGLSLITITENLWTHSFDDFVNLSARQDLAPTLGINQREYAVYQPPQGDPTKVNIDEIATPGTAEQPWRFEFPDLQWQFDRARQIEPDYDFSERDPCAGKDPEQCHKAREKRGFAGLPGGHWLALTYRANTIKARSFGQPGGNGGPGLDAIEDIVCGAAPVSGPQCGYLGPACDGLNNPAGNSSCTVQHFGSQDAPHTNDLCACDDTCQETRCSVNYKEDDPSGQCAVTCRVSPLAEGFQGGQPGPGGEKGIIKLSVVTRVSSCSRDVSEGQLSDPSRIHALDERCVNGVADDGDPNLVDCDSEFCSRDPNVSVCESPGDAADRLGISTLLGSLTNALPEPDIDLSNYNAIINPLPPPGSSPSGTNEVLIDLGGGRFATLIGEQTLSVPTFGGILQTPTWAAASPIVLPDSLLSMPAFFEDAQGQLILPSAAAEALLVGLSGEATGISGVATRDVLGFEKLPAWSSNVGTLELTTEHTEGAAALSVPAAGWVELVSAPLPGVGAVGSTLSFDLSLPEPAVNPWWAGDVSVAIDAPSAGVYSVEVGRASLQGVPLGTFQRFSFTIPSSVSAALTSFHDDLRVKIRLNVPQGTGRYLIDALQLGTLATVETQALSFHFAVPEGGALGELAIVTSSSLTLADGARVVDGLAAPALLVNSGSGATNLGVESQAGSLLSAGPVVLRDRAMMQGSVHTESTLTVGSGASIAGSSISGTPLPPLQMVGWTVEVPSAAGSIVLEPDELQVLTPGSYGRVTLQPRSRLRLAAGVYFVSALDIEPGAVLELDTIQGPVVIYVRDSFIYRGGLAGSLLPESLLVAYAGTAPIALEAPFQGTLVAPSAPVRLGTGSTFHSGAVFAQAVELDPGAVLELRSFEFWPLVTGSEGSSHRLAQLLAFVRHELIARNPELAAEGALDPRLLLEIARLSASVNFRNAVLDFGRVAVGVQDAVGIILVRRPDDGPATPPTVILNASGSFARLERNIDLGGVVFSSGAILAICGDTATGAHFSVGGGRSGVPGPGGSGKQRRCNGFDPTLKSICVRPPTVNASDCRRGDFPGRDCPDPACRERYRFPNDAGECPSLYALKPLPTILGVPVSPCPSLIEGEGGVGCVSRDGLPGPTIRPSLSSPSTLSRVRGWTRGQWSLALNRLHPLELRRRTGRGNTLFKRSELVAASARYLSTANLAEGALGLELPLEICTIGLCPDPCESAALTDRKRRLCAMRDELFSRVRQIDRSENFYGYPENYVPPTSVRVRDPAGVFDLETLVRQELGLAREQSDFWAQYGAILKEFFLNTGAAQTRLDTELAFLADQTGPNGSLSQEFQLADQRVDDAFAEIANIRAAIANLNFQKTRLADEAGGFEIDLVKLGGIVVWAGATAYGGPLAGFVAGSVWNQAMSASDAKDRYTDLGGASVKDGCFRNVEQAKKEPDSNPCSDNFKDEALKALGEEVGQPLLDAFKRTFLDVLGLGQPAASNTLGSVILDATISELMVELFQETNELGQALLERRLAREKLNAAFRQVARLEADKNTLRLIGQSSTFPAPEVQLQIAELAFLNAAEAVDRAGEHFFLLRRGVEREVVSADPVTSQNIVVRAERQALQSSACSSLGITVASLDINFLSIGCFEQRVTNLVQQAAAARLSRSLDFLELEDTTVPFTSWALVADTDGQPAYAFDMPISFEMAQRGTRRGEAKQRISDITLYLESNDPTPAAIRMKLRRPTTSPDVYFLGEAPDATNTVVPHFQVFDVALGAGAAPDTPLFELLRERTRYEHVVFVCNGLSPASPGPPALLEQCKLSGLGENERAFLEGRSLIGTLEFTAPVADLGSRTPVKLFADMKYSYVVPGP